MSDTTKADIALLAAVAATGKPQHFNAAWRDDVMAAIGPIASMMSERSPHMLRAEQMFAEDTKRFVTYYERHEIESTSKRVIVYFCKEDGSPQMTTGKQPKQESVRTDRTDTAAGKRMLALFEALKPGTRIAVHIVIEQKTDDLKVRILIHCQPLGGPRAETRNPAGPPPEGSPPEPSQKHDSGGGQGAAPGPIDDPDDMVNSNHVNGLRAKAIELLGVHRWNLVCGEVGKVGIDANVCTYIDWVEHVRPACQKIASTVPEEEEPF